MKLVLHPNPVTPALVDTEDVYDDLLVCISEADGDLSMEEIVARVRECEAQVWTIHGDDGHIGTVLTEGRPTPGCLWLNIVAIRVRYNDEDAFAFALDELNKKAKAVGARLCGESRRPGMERHLERLGWQKRFVQYVAP